MGVPGLPNIPWPWSSNKKQDYVPTPPTPTPIISTGPNGLPRIPNSQPGNGNRSVADAYLEQLKRRNEEAIAATRVGTTSRAYANTQGAQKDMLPTAEIQRRYDAANGGVPSNSVGSGGSGGMGASPEPSLESLLPTRTDLGSLYDQLVQKLTGYGDTINQDFAGSEKFIRDQYDRSNVGLTGNYSNANKNLELAKAGLGFGDTSAYQQNMNSITENADLSETADLSYLEKMKNARGIEMKDILGQVERDRIAQQNAQDLALQEAMLELIATRSGGGGSGGGRGGSGSSGDKTLTGSQTSTQTDTIENPQFQAQFEYILATEGPEAAAQYRELIDSTMGNSAVKGVTGAIGKLAPQYQTMSKYNNVKPVDSRLPSWVTKLPNQVINQGKNVSANQKAALATLERLRQAAYVGSGLWGNPSTKVTNVSTGKISNPKTKVD